MEKFLANFLCGLDTVELFSVKRILDTQTEVGMRFIERISSKSFFQRNSLREFPKLMRTFISKSYDSSPASQCMQVTERLNKTKRLKTMKVLLSKKE